MKIFIHLFTLLFLIFFTNSLKDGINLYTVDEIMSYFNTKKYTKEQYEDILGNLTQIFELSYAFNDISKTPPQPFNNYHPVVDIQEKLKQIEVKDIENVYDFFRKISIAFSSLKDQHIRIFFNDLYLNYFFIAGPFHYYIDEDNEGKQRIFAECLPDEVLEYFIFENDFSILDFCHQNQAPVKSINGKDPFEYINNFGGNFAATKNIHGTFSFKMNFHNLVSLNDYPLSEDELNTLEVIFDDEDETNVKTKYLIETELNIDLEHNLRLLSDEKKINKELLYSSNNINNNINKKIKKVNLRKLSNIEWNYEAADFKCYVDTDNKINLYYVLSFEPQNREEYIEIMEACARLFDQNTNPIVVINDNNVGGYVSLTQLFMGVLSPLMPINLFKGRLRVTESLTKTDEILEYIKTNLTDVHNCQSASLDDLLDEQVQLKYTNTHLTGTFYISNKTIHNKIEEIRQSMKNKRKPTEILVLTDGYSLSTAGLYIKYLQKMGGALVAGFKGNPYDNSVFDSGQSPSMVFTSDLLNIFNKEENEVLKNNNIVLEIPTIQTFYELDDKETPLEYEVNPIDIRIKLYKEFSSNTYNEFVNEALKIFNESKEKCYSNNLIKFDEECDKNFEKHTHGGYACNNEENTWSNSCVEAYCDLGYSFDKNNKKCVKDICSSIPIDDEDEQGEEEDKKGEEEESKREEEEKKDEEEENKGEEEEEKENDEKDNKIEEDDSTVLYIVIFTIIGIIVIFIIVFIVMNCKNKRMYSSDIDFSK